MTTTPTITRTHPHQPTWEPLPGRIVVHAPAGDAPDHLGRHLQVALNRTRIDRRSTNLIDTVALLHIHQITQVIIDDAARVPIRAIDWTHRCTLSAGSHLVLALRSEPHPDMHRWLAHWPSRTRLPHRIPKPSPPALPTTPEPFPPVPDHDWPWFRTQTNATLTGDDHELIEATYLHALHTTQRDLTAHPHPYGNHVIASVRRQLIGIDDANHALTVLRAAAAAAFKHGVALQANPDRIRHLYRTNPNPTPTRTDRALTLAAVAAGISIDDLLSTRHHQAAALIARLAPHHQPLGHQHHLARTLQGAQPADPWLTTPLGEPATRTALTQVLRRYHPGGAPQRQPTGDPITRWSHHSSIRAHRYRP